MFVFSIYFFSALSIYVDSVWSIHSDFERAQLYNHSFCHAQTCAMCVRNGHSQSIRTHIFTFTEYYEKKETEVDNLIESKNRFLFQRFLRSVCYAMNAEHFCVFLCSVLLHRRKLVFHYRPYYVLVRCYAIRITCVIIYVERHLQTKVENDMSYSFGIIKFQKKVAFHGKLQIASCSFITTKQNIKRATRKTSKKKPNIKLVELTARVLQCSSGEHSVHVYT